MKTRGRPRHPDVLTPREWEVLTLLREGLTNPQIAERMGITLDAAKYHVSEILSKLHLGSREEAAAWQPEPAQVAVLRPSWANALFRWWPFFGPIASASLMAAAVAGLGVLAYGVIKSEREEDPSAAAPPSATAAPSPSPEPFIAEQVITDGMLVGFDATESGAMLTVWETCRPVQEQLEQDCGLAWRVASGSQTQATGMVDSDDYLVDANASGDGFLLLDFESGLRGLHIAQNGTVSPLSTDCGDATWSTPLEPGRLVWAKRGNFVDTVAGAICPSTRLGGRPLAQGVFTDEGTLWALVDNESGPDTLTIGRYDGAQWSYHDLAAEGFSWNSVIAAAGSNVVVLQGGPQPSHADLIGFAVTTDDGATWSEVIDPAVLERDLPFSTLAPPNTGDWFYGITSMAFAGTSTLYVADALGYLWRSTDFATFSRVLVPFDVADLKSAGDEVIARIDDGVCSFPTQCQLNDLVRISADGSVEPITIR